MMKRLIVGTSLGRFVMSIRDSLELVMAVYSRSEMVGMLANDRDALSQAELFQLNEQCRGHKEMRNFDDTCFGIVRVYDPGGRRIVNDDRSRSGH